MSFDNPIRRLKSNPEIFSDKRFISFLQNAEVCSIDRRYILIFYKSVRLKLIIDKKLNFTKYKFECFKLFLFSFHASLELNIFAGYKTVNMKFFVGLILSAFVLQVRITCRLLEK